MSAPDHPAGRADAWQEANPGYDRLAEWLIASLRLDEAERTRRPVIVTTQVGVTGPAVVEASSGESVTLRTEFEEVTVRVIDAESVIWAPPVEQPR